MINVPASDRFCASRQGAFITLASFLLSLLTGCGGAYLASTTQPSQRAPLRLTAPEREHLRAGMRVYLESIEGITQALADNKMQAVAKSATRSGQSLMDESAVAMVLKLPPEFVAASIDTHGKFEALAANAAAGAPKAQLLDDLGQILSSCTACHATYRLSPE
jgi:cytochrome c556